MIEVSWDEALFARNGMNRAQHRKQVIQQALAALKKCKLNKEDIGSSL
jgi:hypothetical protein